MIIVLIEKVTASRKSFERAERFFKLESCGRWKIPWVFGVLLNRSNFHIDGNEDRDDGRERHESPRDLP